jgi:DsbC/DsbD-like thiol-disulfide interchange protein
MITAAIRPSRTVFATISAAGMLILAAGAAPCAEASDWNGDARSALRLVSGGAAGEILRAGVEIRLASGWKTYWRYPGDSGIPPRFDFSGSENVKSATLLWPAPRRFSDAEGVTIGYADRVLFPLHVEAWDATRPVTLHVKADYAICEKLCVPALAEARLTLDRSKAAGDAVADAEKHVPRPTHVGAEGPLTITQVRKEAQRVVVDVATPPATPVELFAEGPTSDWSLPIPEPIVGAPTGHQRFAFALDGLPPGAKAEGAVLTLTAVAGGHAIEARYRLD